MTTKGKKFAGLPAAQERAEDRGELSGLVETLLSEWLTSRKP